jgi:phthiocerol/phenolphthiocerol synthesis type-I polyketide synthase C
MNQPHRPRARQRIAIVGYAFRFPGSAAGEFWTALCEGRNLVGRVHESRWATETFHHPRESEPGASYTRAGGTLGDVSGFDAAFFGISPREAAQMDPQQRLLLELAWESLESGGIRPSTLRGSRCGVLVGFSGSDYGYRGADDLAGVDSYSITGVTASIAANRISYCFDLRGPSMAVDTACSSSLVAFHQACQSILSGDADTAIAGAVNLHLHPLAYVGFSKASMLSKNGVCRVFDAAGDGYVRSEGGAVMVLKPLEDALADGNRILAVVAGSGLNSDGRTNGMTVPSAEAQAALLEEVYAKAGIDPSEIDYLEAHGTGTPVGDPIEARALGEALGRRRPADSPLRIGSVKSNLGHLETASGMAGLVKALLCLEHRSIPRSIHFDNPNPRIAFDEWNLEVVAAQTPLAADKRLVIGVNSFGFGGANAHVILESYVGPQAGPQAAPHAAPAAEREAPFFLSARSDGALKATALAYAALLRERTDLRYYDIAYSAAFSRDWHPHRAIAFGFDRESTARALDAFGRGSDSRAVASGRALARPRGPVFVYSGNGAQWAGMGGALLAESPVFANAVTEVDALVQQFSDVSVLKVLAGGRGEQRLDATEIAQPALFAVQVGLTRLLASWGMRPRAVVGHSVGEIAAAWACGALSLEQAAFLVCERSAWQGTTRGTGTMTAVALGADEMESLLGGSGSSVGIAAINSPDSVTVSGTAEDLKALELILRAKAIAFQRLALDYAFHSALMDPIRAGIEGALRSLTPRAAAIPFYSAVSGAALAGEALDAGYWWRNIRDPVRFGDALARIIAAGESIFCEIGPQPILRNYVGECLRAAAVDGRVIASMARNADGIAPLRLRAFDALIAGADADLAVFFPEAGRPVELPTYPWQRERHWREQSVEGASVIDRRSAHPLLGYRPDRDEYLWECQLDCQRAPVYADHRLGGEAILPAAGYVEMALAAGVGRDAEATHEIEELEIRSPLPLGEHHSQTVRFTLGPQGSFYVRSRQRLSDEPWRVHAVGRLATGPRQGAGAPAFEAQRPAAVVSAEKHYRLAAAVGLEYGPAFQVIDEVWPEAVMPRNSVSAVLRTPPALRDELARTQLHPAFLDGAFQLLLHLLDVDGAEGHAFIPVRVGRVTLLRAHAEARFARTTLTRRGPRSLVAQCVLYDSERRPIAVLRDVRLRAVALRKTSLAGLACLHARAVPAPLPSASRRAALPPADRLIATCSARLHASARQQKRWRYFNDVEPLLEALLSAFAAEATRKLRGEQPEALLEARVRRLAELAGEDDEIADPAALWAQMLRDYPDHASEILWIGRLGMHFADIARGVTPPENFLPRPDGEDGDAWSGAWMPATADYAQAIADLVEHSISALPHGRRLRVLAINAEHEPAVANVLARLDSDRCELVVAQSGSPRSANLQARSASFDLVLVEDGLASTRDRELALGELRTQIADDGILVLLERHPSRAVLLAMDFLDPGTNVRPRVQPLAPAVWHAELARQGFQHVMVVEDVPGIEASSYLLVARALSAETLAAGANAAPEQAARRWLVVADKFGVSARVAAGLTRELQERGQSVQMVGFEPGVVPDWRALLAAMPLAPGEQGAVVHLCGLAETRLAPERVLKRQALRCDSLGRLLAACSAAEGKRECWAVTARAASALLPEAVRAALRLETSADDAAYWGFARSAINEHPEVALRLVDLAIPDPAQCAAALAESLLQPDAEDELVLTQAGRYVVRMDSAPFMQRAARDWDGASLLRLESAVPGQLKNLRWTRHPLRSPGEGEVAIEVRAAGLNFRDVMYAMGQLSDEALESGFAGPTLGMEVAGVVAEVGRGVRGLARGEEVIAFVPAGFATRAITRASAVMKKPAAWTFEAAATVQTAFFTAYYALHHLGRLARGEKLLIHGAAGGVGLAAIQIAQLRGAEVFATAGSEAKRDLLRLLGVKHVLDSRSLAFADEILARTGGEGVDLVLNSLAGEAMQRSLQVLRPTGRFLELGKRDFYENTRIGLRPLRNNISYFGIDADQLMLERPDFSRGLMQELMQMFRAGRLQPLPYSAFRAQDAVSAFRFMQQSRHIGKIVLTLESPPVAEVDAELRPAAPRRLSLRADASYLVTGGTRGFGLRTAQWLAERGARHLVLIGRGSALAPESREALDALAAAGVQVKLAACDVTDRAALRKLLAEVRDGMPPLRGVVHASAVFRDGLVRNLDRESIEAVLAPKMLGAANLHRLTRHLKLDFFVLYSSATSVFGNPGQASYVGANRYLEVLAEARRAAGLPALCVAWGPIEDAGYLARNEEIKQRLESRLGSSSFSAAQALEALEMLLLNDVSGLAVLRFDRAALSRFFSSARSPKYQPLITHAGASVQAASSVEDLRRWAEQTDEAEVLPALAELVKKEIADILRMDPARLDAAAPLQDLGLDSLMAVELMTAVEARCGVSIPAIALADIGTIDRLARRIVKELKRGQESTPDQPQGELEEQVRSLAARHASEVDRSTIEEIAADLRVDGRVNGRVTER